MPKATIKRTFTILLSLTCVFLASCSNPEAERARQINEARELAAEGQAQEALTVLEDLSADFPNDGEILGLIGEIYLQTGDEVSAAFYLEQALLQRPGDVELLYQTYRAKTAAGQPASDLLERLASEAPNTMTPDLWVRLGQSRAAANRTQPALDAYLRGVDTERGVVEATDAVAIGDLFLRLDNLAQAGRWFEIAADRDDPAAEAALLGLLEIRLRRKQWEAAESTIARLDRRFPGAVDGSEWADARQELQRWRAAREKMRAERQRTETAGGEAEAETSAGETAETAATTAADAGESAGGEGKARVIADMEAAEALADTPAVEPEDPETVGADDAADADDADRLPPPVTFNPEIAIEPADPNTGIEVTFDQQSNGAAVSYNVGSDDDATATATAPPAVEAETPRTVDTLLAEADAATRARDFDRAARLYWQALGQANTRADIWNRLSQVYLLDGETKNAETAALEATRLAPDDIAYALDYLRVAQRTKESDVFLGELETTYARFPRNPELTLSLARAYERISRNDREARELYSRFIELAPNHPLRPEAERAVARLR